MTDDSPDTKERILDAAEVAFADLGLTGARVNAIAEAAGVNKAMLYYYFQSKDGLYAAVLERVFGEIQALIQGRFATADASDIGAFLEGYRNILRSHPHFVRIMVREMADGGGRAAPILQPKLQAVVGRAVGGLSAAKAAGRVNPDVEPMVAMPVLIAPFVMFALVHPLFTAATGLPADLLRPLFDQTAEQILLHGLLAHPASEEAP